MPLCRFTIRLEVCVPEAAAGAGPSPWYEVNELVGHTHAPWLPCQEISNLLGRHRSDAGRSRSEGIGAHLDGICGRLLIPLCL